MKVWILTVSVLLGLSSVCEAKRFDTVNSAGKPVVAHTSRAPVIVHRVLPPYGLGKHVYAGNIDRDRR